MFAMWKRFNPTWDHTCPLCIYLGTYLLQHLSVYVCLLATLCACIKRGPLCAFTQISPILGTLCEKGTAVPKFRFCHTYPYFHDFPTFPHLGHFSRFLAPFGLFRRFGHFSHILPLFAVFATFPLFCAISLKRPIFTTFAQFRSFRPISLILPNFAHLGLFRSFCPISPYRPHFAHFGHLHPKRCFLAIFKGGPPFSSPMIFSRPLVFIPRVAPELSDNWTIDVPEVIGCAGQRPPKTKKNI